MEGPAASTLADDTSAPADDGLEAAAPEAPTPQLIEDELLIEEISIDGMCGVY